MFIVFSSICLLITADLLKTNREFKGAICNLERVEDEKGSYTSREEEAH